MDTPVRIGIDLGGSKIEALAIDSAGRELLRERIDTPAGHYQETISAIRDLVLRFEQRLNCRATVGVGMPGTLSAATGLVKNSNSVCLIGKPFDRDLGVALGRELKFSNDANCFTLSEATDGAAAGADVVFGVIIGTGTGAGIAVHQRVLGGVNGIAGEFGHNPLPWPLADELPGNPCYCGKSGCIETWLSGPAFEREFTLTAGRPLPAAAIAALAERGDTAAESCLSRYADRLARALASVINVLDPDVIVLGGGMSNVPRLYETVPRRWGEYVFSDAVATRLVAARFGDASGVRGAAWL